MNRFANRYNLAFLASLLLLGILYVEGRRTEVELRAANSAALRTMALVSASQSVLSALQDIESGARGFVITERREYLESFQSGLAELKVSRANLVRALPSDDWHKRWLTRMTPAIQRRVQASQSVVEAVRAGSSGDGARVVQTGAGRIAMEQVRRHVQELQTHERLTLRSHNLGIVDRTWRTSALRLALLLAAGVLLLSAVLAINFQAERRRHAMVTARAGEARERQQHIFLRTIIDTDENPIFVRDSQGRFILSNRALGDLVGCTPEKIESEEGPGEECLTMLQPLLEQDPSRQANGAWRVDAVQMIDAKWEPRWFQVVKRVLPSEGRDEVLTVAVDISSRMRAERVKDEFVSTVSHELRTPLTSVRGAVDLLSGMESELPTDARPLVEIAKKNAERLLRLINDILDLQKHEAGELTIFSSPNSLQQLLEHAVHQHEGYAAPLGVSLHLSQSPDVEVLVDADRFLQVMANLLSNAIKHSPTGGRVEVSSERIESGVEISVRDYGRGIPKDFRPRVFERFTQAESNDARRKGGTGLGLAIAKSMVERMGGTIGFETAEGLGSTFHIVLPLEEKEA